MNEKRNDTKSLVMLIGSMLIFGTVGIFRRYIPLPSALLACCRGLIGSAFLLALMGIKKGKKRQKLGAKKTAALALMGALIGLNWLLLFEAYNHRGNGDTMLLHAADHCDIALAAGVP